MSIKKQTNSHKSQSVLNMAKASGNEGNNLGQGDVDQKELQNCGHWKESQVRSLIFYLTVRDDIPTFCG
jgi:hypothetical protein